MKALDNKKASLLPFQVSASKRWMSHYEIPRSQLSIDPIPRNVAPDKKFALGAQFQNKALDTGKDDAWVESAPQDRLTVLPISSDLMSNLGLKVLPNQRVCIAEKVLAGILMPKDIFAQAVLLRRFLVWFLPCMEIQRNTALRVNNACFAKRENAFLKVYFHSLRRHEYRRYFSTV